MVQPSGVGLLVLKKRPVLVVGVGTGLDGAFGPGAVVGRFAGGTEGVVDDIAISILLHVQLGVVPVAVLHLNGEDSVLGTSVNHLGGPLSSGDLELFHGNTTLASTDIRGESIDDSDEFVKGGITSRDSLENLLNECASVSSLANISDNGEGIRDGAILGLELNPTISAPCGDGKVLEVVRVGEVPLGGNLDCLASLDFHRLQGAIVLEDNSPGLSWSVHRVILARRFSALIGDHTVVPGVSGDVDSLVDLRGQLEQVARARSTTVTVGASGASLVAKVQVVVVEHLFGIKTEVDRVEVGSEVGDGHVEETVVAAGHANLSSESISPERGFVGPVAMVGFSTVGVADVNESNTVGKLSATEDGVSMTHVEADGIGVLVATGGSASRHHVALFIEIDDVSPEFVILGRVELLHDHRRAIEDLDSMRRATAFNVLVVSVELSPGLLENHAPHGGVSADVGEKSSNAAVPFGLERHVVVDNDGVGNSESVEVDAVDAI